jgi:transcriptional regulatory protein RtcR
MGTLAESGRIPVEVVDEEIERLKQSWRTEGGRGLVEKHLGARAQEFDRFDLAQLEEVLRVLSRSSSLSEAGRELFGVTRLKKASSNDADRLKKYLARFDLDARAGLLRG